MPSRRALIAFDIGNVLLKVHVHRAVKNFEAAAPGLGRAVVDDIVGASLGIALEKGEISGLEFYRRLKAKRRFDLRYDAFRRCFNDIFEPIRENLSLFSSLAARHPVALLSNTNPIHWSHIRDAYPAFRLPRWPVISFQVGAMKPDPRIYKALAERTRTSFERIVFIDDLAENVAGAARMGIRALRYTGPASFRRAVEAHKRLIMTNGGPRG